MNPTSAFRLTPMVAFLATALMTAQPASAQETPPDTTVPMVPHDDIGRGDIRSETLAAALRLKGLANSFEPDSFIAHILYVTGIVDKDTFPARGWATALTRRLKGAGLLKAKAAPAPGDLVFFSLSPGAPHSAKAAKVSVGVVERVRKGRIDFVAVGSGKVIGGTLKTGKGKLAESKLTACTITTGKAAKTSGGKSGKKSKSGKKKGKTAAKTKAATGKKKQVPCRASELLIGFASIEDAALELNAMPPCPPVSPAPAAETPAAPEIPAPPEIPAAP